MTGAEILAAGMLLAFIGLILTGFPVAWILGGLAVFTTALAIILEVDFAIPTQVNWDYTSLTVDRTWNVMQNWVLVALPMFIYMGLVLERSGIAEDLMKRMVDLFGAVRGGMAITVTLIGILLAATTGIIGASVVLLTVIGMPAMLDAGYRRELAAGTVCSAGTLGILIPPSIMLVLMADRLAMPVGDLFLGALFPGLLLGFLYLVYLLVYCNVRPDVAPAVTTSTLRFSRRVANFVPAAVAPLALMVAVLGSIFFGIATPTEAAGVGALGATLLAAIRRRLTVDVLRAVLRETTMTTGFIFAIFLGATAFSLVLRGLGGDEMIESALLGLSLGPHGTVIVILAVTFLLGFFLDWIEITLVVLPLVAPVVAGLGFDPVWFTILFALCLQTSFLTPPVGFAIFYLRGAAPEGVDVRTIYRGVIPFILLQLIALALVYGFSSLVTWLPARAY